MKNSEKKWLESASWTSLMNIYQTLCQGQKVEPLCDKAGFEKARQYWDSQVGKSISLPQALEACKKCHDLHPFVFNNGNTLAAFAKKLVEDWAQTLPSVEAQMLLTTVGHFVTGKISRRELNGILDFLAPSWQRYQATATLVIRPQPQPERESQVEAQPDLAPARELIAS